MVNEESRACRCTALFSFLYSFEPGANSIAIAVQERQAQAGY